MGKEFATDNRSKEYRRGRVRISGTPDTQPMPRTKKKPKFGTTHPTSVILAFDWFDQRIYEGIFRFAKEKGWHLSPYLISGRFIPRGWPGDGAITCYGKTLKDFILSLDMPKVDVTIDPIPRDIPRVVVDNEAISQLAAKHFLDRGFKHFAYYSWPGIGVNAVRHKAFFAALRASGVPSERLHTLHQTPSRYLGLWDAHQEHLRSQIENLPRPLAVFAGQDNLGATLIEICARTGIHVPEEVAVLGVDNIEFLCEGMAVPMSSIDTRLDQLGYEAARRLDQLMRGEIGMDAETVTIPPKGVIDRRSTEMLAIDHSGVIRALAFMNAHAREMITLEDICAHAGMSKRGLEKAFLKHLDISPAGELRRIRLDKAKKMLAETDEKIEWIAKECGYSNSSNLSFALRRDTALSPKSYRNRFGRTS